MIHRELQKREAESNPIKIGASAIDWMGSGFVNAVSQVPGMEVSVIANADTAEAAEMYRLAGVPTDRIVETSHPGEANDAVRAAKFVVTEDLSLPSKVDDLDILTDVTWSPALGAQLAYSAIHNGKDVMLVNIEADVTVGPILKKLAAQAGVLYSVSSGDEPGCLIELYDFACSMGHEIITIGKGKNNPLDPSATPETVAESARRADKDPFQVSSYVDGTKTMFEMTCAANATGCRPMQAGMIGPEADLNTVSDIFALVEDGGLSRFPGNVDFVQGDAMAGGVFVTVRVEDKRIQDDLNYLKVGNGKYFTFFRPYHLWFLEAPISIARAVLHRQVWLEPLDRPVAEVVAVAKRDLQPGEVLDRFGGFTSFGRMVLADEAIRQNALPAGLTPAARMKRPLSAGEYLTWDDVDLDEESTVVSLRRQQDQAVLADA
ncbi:MAG: SAF domain-containing protein [Anaerolineales bacterium]|nr:SAF domain-containing protein [Anaerolineales bacterium]